ncbi:MAG TPA: tetrathionate reductase subunit TtrA [Euryarchaeota archaeon]|nr:tetrathionate reductase subunit A precursor [archaeon BMS3Bbin15]HDL16028.1 tetrathionate reductase subunit TtrA [Euryarchaeota archaeon]
MQKKAQDSHNPEFEIDIATGKINFNPEIEIKSSTCLGCWSCCGMRVAVDRKTGKIVRVSGNPYHPNSTGYFLPYNTSILDSFQMVTMYKDMGNRYRTTVCARGNAAPEIVDDPRRILTPLKRAGKRGEGLWKPITWEQLIEETVNGGRLFEELGEDRFIEGLRHIRDLNSSLDPENPEFGTRANLFIAIGGRHDGRTPFFKSWVKKSFGSVNWYGHGGTCGLNMRIAYRAFLDTWDSGPQMTPDFRNSEFIIYFGSGASHAGNPMQFMGRELATGRSERNHSAVFVSPFMPAGVSASSDKTTWLPIRPGSDGALAMAIIRWIIEHKKYNRKYLRLTTKKAARKAGIPSWSNATYLVITEEGRKDSGRFLKADAPGLGSENEYVVLHPEKGIPVNYNEIDNARLFYSGIVTLEDGSSVYVKTSLQILKEESLSHSMEEYSRACGISLEKIVGLAEEFTVHGVRAATEVHGGVMQSNGYYSAMAILTLNALIGNINYRGGLVISGQYQTVARGPAYDLVNFPGGVTPRGANIARGFPYEKTTEYRRKKEKGKNPYPAKLPWYSNTSPEQLVAGVFEAIKTGYPYKPKIIFNWMANPLYTTAGLAKKDIIKVLKDPGIIPLIISCDVAMGETTKYADYIIPDTTFFESWGVMGVWAGVPHRLSAVRIPVVEPRTKREDGIVMGMEQYLIDISRVLDLPGFGKSGIKDKRGKIWQIQKGEDYFLKAIANVAYDGIPVPDIHEDDLNVARYLKRIYNSSREALSREEWKKVLYVLARGGRFEDKDRENKGEFKNMLWEGHIAIYSEQIASSKDSITGKYRKGTASWLKPAFADGTFIDEKFKKEEWPFIIISYKSRFRSVSNLANVRALQELKKTNFIQINPEDAEKFDISSGDRVRIITPEGRMEATAKLLEGVMPGTIAIAFGYGHTEWGSRDYTIGKKLVRGDRDIGRGININPVALRDNSLKGIHLLSDPVCGGISRNYIPAKIEKIGI